MGGEFEGELGEFLEAHDSRQHFTASEAPWQNGPVERNGGIWKAAARKTIKDVGARGFVEMRRLASMVNWAKNARINSSGFSPAQWVVGRGCQLPWSLLDEKQSGELASLELPYHSPELGRLQWVTKELLYPFQFVVKAQARVRDLIKANEFIDEIKQHEDFTLTYGVLDFTSLGGVDRFGYPTDQDSKTVKVYSQAGKGIFIGEKSLVCQRHVQRACV